MFLKYSGVLAKTQWDVWDLFTWCMHVVVQQHFSDQKERLGLFYFKCTRSEIPRSLHFCLFSTSFALVFHFHLKTFTFGSRCCDVNQMRSQNNNLFSQNDNVSLAFKTRIPGIDALHSSNTTACWSHSPSNCSLSYCPGQMNTCRL